MTLWRFMDFVTAGGRNLIAEWYAAQDADVQAEFDTTLLFLKGIADWEHSDVVEHFKPLVQRHSGLGEIRFYIDERKPGSKRVTRRRFRPVGIWPARSAGEFIIILGCEKKRMQYIPHAAFDIAMDYKQQFDEGKGTTCVHA